MDITVGTRALGDLLGQVADVAGEKKGSMPILACVLLRAEQTPEGGRLTATCYDLEIGLEASVGCEVAKAGAVAVPAAALAAIAKTLPEQLTRLRVKASNRLEISSGAAEFKMAGLDAADFPALPEVSKVEWRPVGLLRGAVGQVAFAMSHDETRYNLNGVLLDLANGAAVATDGHRMAWAPTDVVADEPSAILPRKAVAKLRKLLGSEMVNTVDEFGLDGSSLLYRRAGLRLVARLVDGQFPAWKQVVPELHPFFALVDRAALLASLRRVTLVAQDRAAPIALELQPEGLRISCRSPEGGEAVDLLPVVEWSTAPRPKVERWALNPGYLQDMLAATDVASVALHLDGDMDPLLIEAGAGLHYVQMPMRG